MVCCFSFSSCVMCGVRVIELECLMFGRKGFRGVWILKISKWVRSCCSNVIHRYNLMFIVEAKCTLLN